MGEIDTDYLVVGAGVSALAFVDALLAKTDARVVIVDRRHRPGGHWLDAYPFVQLHQPSANYGVTSRRLGDDRIDTSGPNAGFYERARPEQICDYFDRVLDDLVADGRVRFLGLRDYRGADADGHHVVSLLSGRETTIRARRLVDATYVASEIPMRHTPAYTVDTGVRVIPPNHLVDLAEAAEGFTIIGAGKTAMDTCSWLLDAGVDPDRIQWIRSRDVWSFSRTLMQPLDLVGAYMELQAHWVAAAAETTDGADFARRLEAAGVFTRIDPDVEPAAFRGPIISEGEVASLRTIERVVRKGKVLGIEPGRIRLDGGDVAIRPDEVCVDCTAAGVPASPLRPVFARDRITLQYVTIGIVPWSAATVGTVEALRDDDGEKNRLCPPVSFSGDVASLLDLAYAGMTGLFTRAAEPDLAAWTESCRLNPAMGALARMDDPRVASAVMTMATHVEPAMANLGALVADPVPA
jgi:NAD(P)-binding Rossmann-like domain